jgi:hypothetical protein
LYSRHVVVDDQRDLLHIDTTSPNVGSDENSGSSTSELGHDGVSLLLDHLSVHAADSEVGVSQLGGQPVDLSSGVTEDDSLRDGQSVVQVTPGDESGSTKGENGYSQGVILPVLLLDGDKELLDALEGQLVTLDEDSDRVSHELGGHLQNVMRQRGRDDNDLSRRGKVSVDVVDLIFETLVEQLVGFIEDKNLGSERFKRQHSP